MGDIINITVGNLRDIPSMMRRVADAIERGEHGAPDHAILVLTEDDRLQAFHWGTPVTYRYLAGTLLDAANEVLR